MQVAPKSYCDLSKFKLFLLDNMQFILLVITAPALSIKSEKSTVFGRPVYLSLQKLLKNCIILHPENSNK